MPTEVDIETNDTVETLANPNVTTILPGQLKTEDDIIDYKPPVNILTSDNYVTDHVPLQLDTDQIIMTDDGDVILTEPDIMQVSKGVLVPISNDSVQLENDTNMNEIATRNIVLKRKQPDVSVANIKKTKGDTKGETKTRKYQIEPENVEKKALNDDNFREKFDFYRLAKIGKENKRYERYMTKKTAIKEN